jgi:hypothetical protein
MTTTRNPFLNEMKADFMDSASWGETVDLFRYWKSVLVTLKFHRQISGGVDMHVDDSEKYDRAEQVFDHYADPSDLEMAIYAIDTVLSIF